MKALLLTVAWLASPEPASTQGWAFEAPRRHTPPAAGGTGGEAEDRIDAFVRARLRRAGVEPSPAAERRQWIRRVTLDLRGLPPAPEEVDAFVADRAPGAHERLVDRLLASPGFGERWARLWLDLARYAEDQAHIVGNDTSLCYPNAYLYRDWVIDAFNRDMPFDRFVELQLAADLIEPGATEDLAALGFLGLGPKYYRRGALEVMADEWEDRVDTVTRGLLGLTVACARCHDHKFDPIPMRDYYALAGVFASSEMFNRPLAGDRETRDDGQAKKPEEAMHIVREGKPRDLAVFLRGDVKQKGPVAPRAFLTALAGAGEAPGFTDGSGRRALARAITTASNPLTARVFVNRIWGALFGRPIVATPSNFGALGDPPTHPELLDDLAVRFMEEGGWSLKWLVRELVLSATYRRSSEIRPPAQELDPQNRWLGRMTRRRLDVETWRDTVLAAAGALERSVGGASIDVADPSARRRTVYGRVSRFELDRMLALFDFPDPNVHAEERVETTTPLQKLFVLNSPFMLQAARTFGARVAAAASTRQERVELAYRLLYARAPTAAELALAEAYLGRSGPPGGADLTRVATRPGAGFPRWEQYAQALLCANELLFVD